jgi:hypothetical protein
MPEKKLEDNVGDVEANLDLENIPEDVAEWAAEKIGENPESRVLMAEELRELVYRK